MDEGDQRELTEIFDVLRPYFRVKDARSGFGILVLLSLRRYLGESKLYAFGRVHAGRPGVWMVAQAGRLRARSRYWKRTSFIGC
jgi:hypothetical protein